MKCKLLHINEYIIKYLRLLIYHTRLKFSIPTYIMPNYLVLDPTNHEFQ